jgi:uncharacterized phiE125 gp8 family phage protein
MTYSHPVSQIQDWRRFPIEWALRRTVSPTFEPVTLDEVRDQLRLVAQDDDALLQSYIVAAREAIEEKLSKALLTQTFELHLSRFPAWELPLPRTGALGLTNLLSTVASIAYLDVNGTAQTRDASLYIVDPHHQPVARAVPIYGLYWPPTRPIPNAVTVTYVTGVATRGDVPQMIRQALLMLVGSLYESREADATSALERLPIFGELMDAHGSTWEPEFA